MSDRTPENQDNPSEAPQNDAINPGRRKLAGAALGAGAVFTLASRPVWANQCTISGMASGNLSAPRVACEGCTPGYWKQSQHFGAWTGFRPVDVSPTQKADTFNAVFGVFDYKKSDGTAYTLLEVLHLQGNDDPLFPKLGAHAVAALLNAASSINYGYTSGEIITLFGNNMGTREVLEELKDALAGLNQRGCPLGNDPGY